MVGQMGRSGLVSRETARVAPVDAVRPYDATAAAPPISSPGQALVARHLRAELTPPAPGCGMRRQARFHRVGAGPRNSSIRRRNWIVTLVGEGTRAGRIESPLPALS